MALLTLVAALGLLLPNSWLRAIVINGRSFGIVEIGLWIMVIGCMITFVRRLQAAACFLKDQERSKT